MTTTVTNCYYLDTCGAAGLGTSKTEAEMKTQEFVNLLNAGGAGFVYRGGYPVQSWEKDNRGTNVNYTVAPTYTVTIPSEVSLGNSFEIKAENVVLEQGKQLEVALTATSGAGNAFTVSNGKTGELTYEVKVGGTPISVGGTVLTVNPTTASAGSATLHFSDPTNTIVYAGDYSGTVTFTVSVK